MVLPVPSPKQPHRIYLCPVNAMSRSAFKPQTRYALQFDGMLAVVLVYTPSPAALMSNVNTTMANDPRIALRATCSRGSTSSAE